jgi:glycosyltransferase involved in cell wall biosynthesis
VVSFVISSVINTFNEEKNIRFCLECLRWCDEIVVVDMCSQDNTVKIAQEFTDKIFRHERTLYFDTARSFAIQMAQFEWILMVDADELISSKLSKTLKNIEKENKADVVQIPRKNYIMGSWIRHTGWWPDYQERFFRKNKMRIDSRLHAYLKPTGRILKLNPTEDNAIIHLNYYDSTHFIEKLNRYTHIEAKQMYENKFVFRWGLLFKSVMKEFLIRFIKHQGYRDGFRGFALLILMIFYRMVSFIKLWEIAEYTKKGFPQEIYKNIQESIAKEWLDTNKQKEGSN